MNITDINYLKVGSTLYDVNFVKKLKNERNDELYGHIDYCELNIDVCNKYPLLRQLQTILHETIHAIDDELGNDRTEKETNQLSNALYAFIIDNPIYIQMILDYQKEK